MSSSSGDHNLDDTALDNGASWRGRLVCLPPNRVWRTYTGGRTLDTLAGVAHPADSSFPEDWLASTTEAINPPRSTGSSGMGVPPVGLRSTGVPPVSLRGMGVPPMGSETIGGTPMPLVPTGETLVPPPEGISRVLVGGQLHDFRTLLAQDPDYFLGAAHVAKHGANPALLVKLLDPAIRLHFQVHPTADFARRHLHAPSGKTEAYHVLATRPEVADPCIYLGFHTPPSRDDLRRWIETQDLAAIEHALNRVSVRPGDTYVVPGGVPHALGAGVFLVEIQEPSDLVVRFEFERGGYVLPESARFMNRGLEFALDVFDLSPWPLSRLALESRCSARRRRPLGPDSYQDDLIGPERTPCFRVRSTTIRGPIVKKEAGAYLAIVTEGAGHIGAGPDRHAAKPFDAFFIPAGLGSVAFETTHHLRLLECYPPS